MVTEWYSKNGTQCSTCTEGSSIVAWCPAKYYNDEQVYWFFCKICTITEDLELSELPEEIKFMRLQGFMNKEER